MKALLLFKIIWKNLINIMLRERSETQKTMYGLIPFRSSKSGKNQPMVLEVNTMVTFGGGGGE